MAAVRQRVVNGRVVFAANRRLSGAEKVQLRQWLEAHTGERNWLARAAREFGISQANATYYAQRYGLLPEGYEILRAADSK